jgi:hypothetical protein
LSVASRIDKSQRRIEVRRWDLDLVEKSNKWEIEILSPDEMPDVLVEPLQGHTLSGPEKWNKQQGFYIYRADRMIQSGGWSRTRTADEHTKLARATIDFCSDLDSVFEVNVAKFRVALPPELKDQLEEPVERFVKRAKVVYAREKNGSKSSRATTAKRPGFRRALQKAAADADETEAENHSSFQKTIPRNRC